MKDYVFIGWSKNRDLAIKVKSLLDQKGFEGVVGGLYEENPNNVRQRKGTVNETINYQMNHCDQAILLFQKLDDNLSISGNLIYELGYISAQYNYIGSSAKVHIFKIDITQADDNLFPSDLHGVWGMMISSNNKTQDELAEEIVEQFIRNQSQITVKEKIQLLNDHYVVELELSKHFENPTMSDYDLAKDILIYQQAAFCYQEQVDSKLKIERFKSKMLEKGEGSRELRWAIDYAELTLDLFCRTIPSEENFSIDMDRMTFKKFFDRYNDIGEDVADEFDELSEYYGLEDIVLSEKFNRLNEFESLLIAQAQEHVSYLILVYLNSKNLQEEEKNRYANEGIKYAGISIKNLEQISNIREYEMYAKILLSYAYKNISVFYDMVGNKADKAKNEKKSFKLRRNLNIYISGLPFVRPSLKDYFTLEYLLQVLEIAKECDDKYTVADYMQEIDQYLTRRSKSDSIRDLLLNSLRNGYKNAQKSFQ